MPVVNGAHPQTSWVSPLMVLDKMDSIPFPRPSGLPDGQNNERQSQLYNDQGRLSLPRILRTLWNGFKEGRGLFQCGCSRGLGSSHRGQHRASRWTDHLAMVPEWTVPLTVFPALGSKDPKGLAASGQEPRPLPSSSVKG